jgi:hypothetical protein
MANKIVITFLEARGWEQFSKMVKAYGFSSPEDLILYLLEEEAKRFAAAGIVEALSTSPVNGATKYTVH